MAGCCDPRAPKPKMLKIGNSTIGILGLEGAMEEVASMGPLTDDQLAAELLSRIKRSNYIPDSARDAYAEALTAEYKKFAASRTGAPEGSENGLVIKVLGPGCKNCRALESEVNKALAELGADARVEKVESPEKIAGLGILMTPGLIINGKIKSTGRVPKMKEIIKWLKEAEGN
ncbi:MAG: thioredoxin family protein [Bacillota bacterium]